VENYRGDKIDRYFSKRKMECLYLSGLITEQQMEDDDLVHRMASELHDNWRMCSFEKSLKNL
jgi:hypothetical protein